MQTEPSEMNMDFDSGHSNESHKKYISNLRNKVRSIYKICITDVITEHMRVETSRVETNRIYKKKYKKNYSSIHGDEWRFNSCRIKSQLTPIFKIQPRFKKICDNGQNEFITTCFTKFYFETSEDDEDKTLNDSKYIINFCGYHLTELNMKQYFHSEIMPLIRDNCPSLKELTLKFKVIRNQDFENAFFNMFYLKKLMINWQCENSTLPLTLVNSLKSVGRTLKELGLESENVSLLPDLLASVFPQLIALNRLTVDGFQFSEALIQSLDKLINLTILLLGSFSLNSRSVSDKRINIYQIDLKNIEFLFIGWEYNVTDEFFIRLCNISKKLRELRIIGTSITDDGMLALNNLSQLWNFNQFHYFGAGTLEVKNELITDQSVTNLSSKKLCHLNISNCTNISNKSVIKIVENFDNLSTLHIENTMVNIEIIEELSKLKKYRSKLLGIWVSFKDSNGLFESLLKTHNIEFINEPLY